MISKASRKKPRTNISAITASTAENRPPGSAASASSTNPSPPRPRKTSEKTDAPIRMMNTIELIFSVVCMTWRSTDNVSCRFAAARTVAPTAPTDADSVAVAMPLRMEPSTATMRPRGGNSVRATRRPSC